MISSDDVRRIVGSLTGEGLRLWLTGGWGVDALLAEQTRPHRDLEILLPDDHLPRAVQVLGAHGFAVEEDAGPLGISLLDSDGRLVRLYPVRFDGGGAVQALPARTTMRVPPQGLAAHGRVGGQPVPCLSAPVQMRRYEALAPTDTRRHAVRLLHERLGLPLPSGYREDLDPASFDLAAGKPLRGRVALVTGVSRRIGIGFAIARHLAACGAELFLHSWSPHDDEQPWGADPAGISGVLAGLREPPGTRVEHLAADLAEATAPERLMRAAVDAFGHIDVLVANHARSSAQDLEHLTAAEIDLSYAVNTRGTLLLVKAFAEQHDGRPGGRVVLFTSGQHLGPMPGELPYIASKGALHQVTASLARHLAGRAITVNTINPGATDTGYADAALRATVTRLQPRGRWGQPADAARLIAWLATDGAHWVTGQILNSNGGGV